MRNPEILLLVGLALILIVIVMHIYSKLTEKKEYEDHNFEVEYNDLDYEERMLKFSEDIINRIEALERQNREIIEKLDCLIGQNENRDDVNYE